MKCSCGAEIATNSGSGYCAICGARKPFAWICTKCNHEVPWAHPTNLVCSTVCPTCSEPKPPSEPSPVIIRSTAVIPNCSGFAQFVLLMGAIVSFLGCVFAMIAAVVSLVNAQWEDGLIKCPFFFLLQAAVFVVFLRVRSLGKER
jgi:hypothetical protein